jgi:hypothetical protein
MDEARGVDEHVDVAANATLTGSIATRCQRDRELVASSAQPVLQVTARLRALLLMAGIVMKSATAA